LDLNQPWERREDTKAWEGREDTKAWERREDTKGTWFHTKKKIFFTWLILREKYHFADFSAL